MTRNQANKIIESGSLVNLAVYIPGHQMRITGVFIEFRDNGRIAVEYLDIQQQLIQRCFHHDQLFIVSN